MDLGDESISFRGSAVGSRSAFIVPRTRGNPTRGDLVEEREASRSRAVREKHGGRIGACKRVNETRADSKAGERRPSEGVHLAASPPR
jgi:hypothetical protein